MAKTWVSSEHNIFVGEWIRATTKMPEDDKLVLISDENAKEGVCIGSYVPGWGWRDTSFFELRMTHWMVRPNPPAPPSDSREGRTGNDDDQDRQGDRRR